ncbi:MAG: LysR family transcriptional regulator [Gaiellales bacterium]
MSIYPTAQLRALVEVATAGSFTRAAEGLGVSQPTVSGAVAALEQRVGVPLLVRARRGVTLTAAGRALLPHAQRALALAADAEEAVDRAVAGERLRLWVAAGEALGTYVLPAALAGLRERMPSLEAGFIVGDVARVLSALRAGEVDVALVTAHTTSSDIQAVEFGRARLVLVGPGSQPVPQRPLSLDDLRDLVLVARDRGTVNRLQVDRLLSEAGVEPRGRLDAFSLEAVKRCVEAGLGVAVAPEMAVARELELGTLRAIPMPALEMELVLCLAWRRGERISPAAEALLDVLRLQAPAGQMPAR